MRIGVGRGGYDTADYVLGNFSSEEKEKLPEIIKQAVNVLERLVTEDINSVMNDTNKKSKFFETKEDN